MLESDDNNSRRKGKTLKEGEKNMRISGDFSKIMGIYNKQKKVANEDKTKKTEAKKDLVSLSNEAKDYQTALKALRACPDIRQEKIKEIEKKYVSGTYDISGKDIADKMVKSFWDEKA